MGIVSFVCLVEMSQRWKARSTSHARGHGALPVVDVPSLTRPAPARPRAKHSVVGGLAVVLRLPDGAPDVSIAKETLTFGLAPTPLSLWYASRVSAQSGLPLGIATASQKHLAACDRLYAIIDRFT
jgi:hypothetical protein